MKNKSLEYIFYIRTRNQTDPQLYKYVKHLFQLSLEMLLVFAGVHVQRKNHQSQDAHQKRNMLLLSIPFYLALNKLTF